ncbi:hypothetical protein [Serratia microhaemolytica]|uniref:hypothetical protein n=1 Tax=Serratia microhaemolytica TaxID=2675110 RepID=UPI000FDED38A|nr:hypothetical protein [Serratia microhaemolytica]
MILLAFKRYAVVLYLLVSVLSLTNNVLATAVETQGSTGLSLLQGINAQASVSALTEAASQLQQKYQQNADYRIGKMFYGYAQLFIANDFLNKKNYMRAAESAKLGFFYIDEAAETDEHDWQMRFLRARMDAFVPPSHGRCVIALQDLHFLQQQPTVPTDLKPMMALMSANALTACQRATDAKIALATLVQLGAEGKRLSQLNSGVAPAWTPAELRHIIQPLAEKP